MKFLKIVTCPKFILLLYANLVLCESTFPGRSVPVIEKRHYRPGYFLNVSSIGSKRDLKPPCTAIAVPQSKAESVILATQETPAFKSQETLAHDPQETTAKNDSTKNSGTSGSSGGSGSSSEKGKHNPMHFRSGASVNQRSGGRVHGSVGGYHGGGGFHAGGGGFHGGGGGGMGEFFKGLSSGCSGDGGKIIIIILLLLLAFIVLILLIYLIVHLIKKHKERKQFKWAVN